MSEKVYNIGDFVFLKSDFDAWAFSVLDIPKIEYAGNRIILNYEDEEIYNEQLLDLFFEARSSGEMENFGTFEVSRLFFPGDHIHSNTSRVLQALFIRTFFGSQIGIYEIEDILDSRKTKGLVFNCTSETAYCFSGRHIAPRYISVEDIFLCEHLVAFIETCFERCQRYIKRQKFRII